MTKLYLIEPAQYQASWTPFAGVRPLSELRAGAWLIRERWAGSLGLEDDARIISDLLTGFTCIESPPVIPRQPIAGPAVVASSTFAPTGHPIELTAEVSRLMHGQEPVAWVVPEGSVWNPNGPTIGTIGGDLEVPGLSLTGVHDLITALEHFLPADCADFLTETSDEIPEGVTIIGDPGEVAIFGGSIDPGVVIDTRNGAVVIEEGASIAAGSRLEGPLFVGAGTRIIGGVIGYSALGPQCRAHGEVRFSVFNGYANKSHDGFLGHSVVGHWVNLGAGTITSNLKNTYGEIRLDLGSDPISTGRTNLGTIFGDHSKTAIGTLFNSGTVVGAGASVHGSRAVPKLVPPFAWGLTGETITMEGFLKIAERVMPRRGVEFDEAVKNSLQQLYHRTAL